MDSPDITDSIYYEDPNLNILLSKIEPLNPSSQEEKDLFTDPFIEKNMTTHYYLQIEDDNQCSPLIESIYSKAKDEIRNKLLSLERELKDCNLTYPPFEMIYKAKSIESVVEQTYNYDFQLKQQMTAEVCYLKTIASTWRRVANDGNCFYRSVMFSYLEYIIFNNETHLLKRIIADLKLKFSPSYANTLKLPPTTQKDLNSISNNISISIMIIESIIIQFLNIKLSLIDRIKNAYIVLIKSFNFCKRFDTTMIYYLRYILYEFISENQNKTYSRELPIQLGELLSSKSKLGEPKYAFEKYFEEDLLKFYVCAEKIAVYMTPLVLKIDLKVIQYENDEKDCIQLKCFNSFLEGKECIRLLYRKSHYNICYSKDYVDKYAEVFGLYCDANTKETSVIDKNEVIQFQNQMKEIPDSNQTKNRIIYQKKKESKDESEIMKLLIKMKKRMEKYKKCSICNQVTKESEIKVIVLPCQCEVWICSCNDNNCFQLFFNSITNIISTDFLTKCFKCPICSIELTKEQFASIAVMLKTHFNNDEVLNVFRSKLNELYQSHCMMCLFIFGESDKKYKIKVKAPFFNTLFNINKCDHLLCKLCLNKQPLVCQICSCYHFRLINNAK